MNKRIGIASMGMFVPEKILTNADLEKMVETNNEWIVTRTGIEERHLAASDVHASDLAVAAAKDCMSRTELKPDLVISSCGTNERKFPYQASIVSNQLHLEKLAAFDLNVGCSGLIYSLVVACSMMQAAGFNNALVTAAEKMSEFVNYEDRTSCILFGDAASAILLSSEQPEHEILAFEIGTDPSGYDEVVMGGRDEEYYFHQDGRTVFKFAVNKVVEVFTSLREKVPLKEGQRLFLIPHQANLRIIQAAAEKLNLSEDQTITNIQKYGNTSSASIGLALREASLAGRFQKGDLIFLVGFGAGLSWAGMALEW